MLKSNEEIFLPRYTVDVFQDGHQKPDMKDHALHGKKQKECEH